MKTNRHHALLCASAALLLLATSPALAEKLASYGDDARYMLRTL